jgi:hypothetical protein
MTQKAVNRNRGWEKSHEGIYITKDAFNNIMTNVGKPDEHIRTKIDYLYSFYMEFKEVKI